MEKPSPHTVFQEKSDNTDWDKYIEQIDLIKLSKKQKANFLEAVEFLRLLFGENFLKKCLRHGHPFMSLMFNAAPMARLQFIEFAKSIKEVSHSAGFNKWVKKLKKTEEIEKFIESSSVLENAHLFYKAGFAVEFEPGVELRLPSGELRKKFPDLKIRNLQNDEVIFVEVSELKSSDGENQVALTYHSIYWLIRTAVNDSKVFHSNSINTQDFHYILPYVNILRGLEPEELKAVIKDIEHLIESVKKTRKFQQLTIKGKVEMAIAPAHDHSKAEQWAKSRNMKDFVEGPNIPLHETQRIRIKVADKMKQLPKDVPSIVIIPASPLLFYAYPIEYFVADIESELLKFPQLLYVSIYCRVGQGKNIKAVSNIGDHLYTQRTGKDFLTEKRIVARNPAFNLHITESSAGKIIKAFGG